MGMETTSSSCGERKGCWLVVFFYAQEEGKKRGLSSLLYSGIKRVVSDGFVFGGARRRRRCCHKRRWTGWVKKEKEMGRRGFVNGDSKDVRL